MKAWPRFAKHLRKPQDSVQFSWRIKVWWTENIIKETTASNLFSCCFLIVSHCGLKKSRTVKLLSIFYCLSEVLEAWQLQHLHLTLLLFYQLWQSSCWATQYSEKPNMDKVCVYYHYVEFKTMYLHNRPLIYQLHYEIICLSVELKKA